MAEYIKKEDAIPYLIKYIPSVEAVEHSKIDKAIEEMERYGDSFDNMGKHNLGSAVENCIEILKRNIGE